MPRPTADSYLSEALKHDYPPHSENRLSQVFAASFNHSHRFRDLFHSFTRIPSFVDSRALTEQHTADGRLDICICDKHGRKAIIENKVDAPLTVRQLRRYAREHQDAKKIALVRDFFEPFSSQTEWRICHWGDFYRHLVRGIEHGAQASVDHFVISNIITYLEDMDLNTVSAIELHDLDVMAQSLVKLRALKPDATLPIYPSGGSVFETANSFTSMLRSIVERSKSEPSITRKAAKNYRFAPYLKHHAATWDSRPYFEMGVSIRAHPRNKKVRAIYTAIRLYDGDRDNHRVVVYKMMKDGQQRLCPHRGKGDVLEFESYCEHVINLWRKWLS